MKHIHSVLRALACLCVATIVLAACGGGHSSSPAPAGPTPTPHASPTSAPTGTATDNPQAFNCPTSNSDVVASVQRSAAGEYVHRMLPRHRREASTAVATSGSQLIAVTYDTGTLTSRRSALAARESGLGATFARELRFDRLNQTTRILSVPAAQAPAVMVQLRAQSGVVSVGLTGQRRYTSSVSAPYFTNDPYFTGFQTTADGSASTFEVLPLVETATVPGQWDMHVVRLDYAFAYGQSTNGSGFANAAALGSNAVKIAIIDTGEDVASPELTSSKLVYGRCYITNSANVTSTSNFTVDEDGHGTNVSGLAAANLGNSVGYVGAGGNVLLYGYRVFPAPNDNCTDPNSTDAQCSTTTLDVASAINDAVAQHVNVINLSLGQGMCNNGQDSDATEGQAVANAIAANIIVVAAAGNATGPPVNAPGCDPGVIAVGATALADGQPNQSGKSGGSPSAPLEYVASYTDYGSPGAAPASAAAWGIVAPGGDPLGNTDADNLHWINNIWTSTPFDSNFAGGCQGDYPSYSGTTDCQTLIAGTSMATPHVAGAAALIISVAPQYQNPALMKQLLCSTAVDIGDPHEGCGRLDIYRAMATALGDPNVPAPNTSL